MTKRILESNGYRTLLASQGTEAVACYVEKGYEISVVLTDLHMPDMGGVEAIAVLRQMNPSVKIIVVTGAGSALGAPSPEEMGVQAYIKKPFDVAHLLVTLNNVLQGKNSSMKSYIALGAILLVILNALLLLPATGSSHCSDFRSGIFLAILVLVFSLIGGKGDTPVTIRPDGDPGARPGCRSASSAGR